jgi:capsule polysaccharide export protein KpsE/RkpR
LPTTVTTYKTERERREKELVLDTEPGLSERGQRWRKLSENTDLLWAERRRLFKFALVGLVIFAALAFLIPARYESTAELMPPDNQNNNTLTLIAGLAGKESPGLGAMAGDLLGIKSTGELFIGVLRSRTVQDRIVQQFDLRKVYGLGLGVAARKKLADRTSISEDRKSGIVTVTVTDHSPQRASQIAGAYIDQLDKMMASLDTSSAHRERVFLENHLKSVHEELQTAETQFSQFASKNATLDVPEQAKALVQSAAILQGQLLATESELQGLKQIYSDQNVRVRSLQARVDGLRKQLHGVAGGASADAIADTNPSDQSSMTLSQLPLLGVPYADLFRKLKVEETVFETLTKEYELAKVQEAKEIPTVKVLDAPDVPEKRSFPPRTPLIILGFLLGFVVGAVLIIGQARWNQIDPDDPGKQYFETWGRRISPILKHRNGDPATKENGDTPEHL